MIVHILNGDALAEQMPELLRPYIVMRECLIEGPVGGHLISSFWENRAGYLKKYSAHNSFNYMRDVRDEFRKIERLDHDTKICLWFEYDLFCQVNMWFAMHYILENTEIDQVYWCHPDHNEWSGFGRMSKDSLNQSFKSRVEITKVELGFFSQLWLSYVAQQWDQLESTEILNNSKYGKIALAVDALLDLHPDFGDNGPIRILRGIKKEYPDSNFE